MEAVGGFLGVAQDADTMALRPKIGWAVCAADRLDVLLTRVVAEHAVVPGVQVERRSYLPEDLCAFYHRTNGAQLFGKNPEFAIRIAGATELEPLAWGEKSDPFGSYGPEERIWHRLVTLADGRWLAINLDLNRHSAPWREVPELASKQRELGYSVFAPVCLCSDATRNKPGANPVVALCFTELLETLLDSAGTPGWLAPGFAGYGDAELFTRRE
jgi:hypothetical protein